MKAIERLRIFDEMYNVRACLRSGLVRAMSQQGHTLSGKERENAELNTTGMAISFVFSLAVIADRMSQDDWNEFWQDMGRRIYKEHTRKS